MDWGAWLCVHPVHGFKVLGVRGLVVAVHRVVMDILCAHLMLLVAPPSFQAPSPSSCIVDEFKCG